MLKAEVVGELWPLEALDWAAPVSVPVPAQRLAVVQYMT